MDTEGERGTCTTSAGRSIRAGDIHYLAAGVLTTNAFPLCISSLNEQHYHFATKHVFLACVDRRCHCCWRICTFNSTAQSLGLLDYS